MCGWQGPCQTGRQVALGSHSRTWVLEPCCTSPCARTHRHAHPEPAESQRRCARGPGSLHAVSWKRHVSLRRRTKIRLQRLQKGALFQCQRACCVLQNRRAVNQMTTPILHEKYIHTCLENHYCSSICGLHPCHLDECIAIRCRLPTQSWINV